MQAKAAKNNPPRADSPLPSRAAQRDAPPWIGSAHDRHAHDTQWLMISGAMLTWGTLCFGWRATLSAATTTLATMLTYLIVGWLLQKIRRKPVTIQIRYGLWLGLLLSAAMPVVLDNTLPILSGLLLGFCAHLIGRSHRIRLHPVALVILLVWLLPTALYQAEPHAMRQTLTRPVETILRPNHLVVGDVTQDTGQVDTASWFDTHGPDDAVKRIPPHQRLLRDQKRILQHPQLLRHMLGSGELPRLEELLLGLVPGPIGATSPLLLIALGLFLMYRQHASWRTALMALAATLITYMLLPLPIAGRNSVVLEALINMGLFPAITFVAYWLLSSPWCLLVLILSPAVDPMSRRGRVIYGLLIGITFALCQWYLSTPEAAYISLILAGLISRPLDALHRSALVVSR